MQISETSEVGIIFIETDKQQKKKILNNML